MKLIPISLYVGWIGLGGYRGYENYNEKHLRNVREDSKALFMYTSAMNEIVLTGCFYGCIPLSIFSAPAFEMMRLEMKLRGLKKEDLPRPKDYFFRI